jgi:large subunit ribosomal protein L18
MKRTKKQSRQRIHLRIRNKVSGSAQRPRLSVFRSNKSIYCQVIDDLKGHTIAAAGSYEDAVKSLRGVEQATAIGKIIAEKLASQNITAVVFDRGGYLYHGRVKALAEGAREGGLQF